MKEKWILRTFTTTCASPINESWKRKVPDAHSIYDDVVEDARTTVCLVCLQDNTCCQHHQFRMSDLRQSEAYTYSLYGCATSWEIFTPQRITMGYNCGYTKRVSEGTYDYANLIFSPLCS